VKHQRSRARDNGATGSRAATIAFGMAAALTATAIYVRRQARRAERANPPWGRFVDVDGIRLHYVERGEGPPVVLLHGNGAMADDFAISGVLRRAQKSYRTIAFDRPGFGYSDRPRDRLWTPRAQAALLAKAFAQLGIERAIVVGHSWGTLVALALALDHRALVRGLVLMAGYYFPTARADVPLFAPSALPVLGDVMRYTISPLLGRLLAPRLIAKIFAPRPVPPRFVSEFPLALALRPWQIRASAEDTAFMIPGAASLKAHYATLDLPVAILAGAGDRIVDVDRQAVALHRALPHSELRVVPGLGHMMHYAVPDDVVAAIDSIAAKTRDATTPKIFEPDTAAAASALS
jgi:pimeloyl-ACP methyl ester carboxylesterase